MLPKLIAIVLLLATPAALAETHARNGEFYAAEKRRAAGGAAVVKTAEGAYQVQLSEDFKSASGPDLYVVLIKADAPKKGRDVRKAGYVRLARLEKNRGAQSYAIPAEIDVADYSAIGIWCEEYSVLFSAASLGS